MNEHWDAVKHPPENALKQIKGGRLSGMTDINPQWRYEAMTEHYGLCGVGWRWTVDKQWIEDGCDGIRCAFVNVSLYVKVDGEWSQAIPGTGGSEFVAKESRGLHCSDEAFKMATTDALSVAMKMVGVGADIYMRKFDGSKYRDDPPSPLKPPPKPTGKPAAAPQKTPPSKPAAKPTDQPDGYEKVMSEGLKYIGMVNDCAGANAMLAMLTGTKHVGTSKADLWKALNDRAAVVGCVYNKPGKQFEPKPDA